MTRNIVHTSKSPFEIWILTALLVGCLSIIISPSTSGSKALNAMPRWNVYVWAASISFGLALCLTGALTKWLWSLYVERGAVLMIGILLVAYEAEVVVVAGWTSSPGTAVIVGLAIACTARYRQISGDIRRTLSENKP
ncbi:MAG TPA: hypothetical protein VHX38_02675 [Pseudonocardiaceae bacterium]|nr:hypothetical protein [Pseudonocardiaceae bacterium]